MQLRELITEMEIIAPTRHAEAWDNVGLIVGDPNQHTKRILLTIDYTTEVAAEAKQLRCDVVIAYHPPIFTAIKRITANGPSALIHDAICQGIGHSIFSAPTVRRHRRDGGTQPLMLADAIGLVDRSPPVGSTTKSKPIPTRWFSFQKETCRK